MFTNLLPERVAIHDIDDVEGFVVSCVLKARLMPQDQHERDEIVSEGMAILLHLARQYKPRMEGYDKDGSFAGYCSIYLPKKIATAWHKWNPQHLLMTDKETGKKRYEYGSRPDSLEEAIDRGESLDSIRCVGDFASDS